MSWIGWLIAVIVLLPGFCLGLMFVPFIYDNPYGNPRVQCLMTICLPILASITLPIFGLINLICWIFKVR